jgi:hypothetical protein
MFVLALEYGKREEMKRKFKLKMRRCIVEDE